MIWRKIPESIFRDEVWKNLKPNDTHLLMWLWMNANESPNDIIWHNGDIVHVEAGQIVTSLNSIVSKTGLSDRQSRTALDHLEATHMISRSPTKRYTLISIENWIPVEYKALQADTATDAPTDTLTDALTDINNRNRYNITDREIPSLPPTLDEVKEYVSANGYPFPPEKFYSYCMNDWQDDPKKWKSWKSRCDRWNSMEQPQTAPDRPNKQSAEELRRARDTRQKELDEFENKMSRLDRSNPEEYKEWKHLDMERQGLRDQIKNIDRGLEKIERAEKGA